MHCKGQPTDNVQLHRSPMSSHCSAALCVTAQCAPCLAIPHHAPGLATKPRAQDDKEAEGLIYCTKLYVHNWKGRNSAPRFAGPCAASAIQLHASLGRPQPQCMGTKMYRASVYGHTDDIIERILVNCVTMHRFQSRCPRAALIGKMPSIASNDNVLFVPLSWDTNLHWHVHAGPSIWVLLVAPTGRLLPLFHNWFTLHHKAAETQPYTIYL